MTDRFNTDWYRKKIREIPRIKGHLLDQINQHRTTDLKLSQEALGNLDYSDLFEIAVAVTNPELAVTLGAGADWSNGKDGKVSIVRRHSSGSGYSAGITGCSNKEHISAIVYEAINDCFYHFDFPVQRNAQGEKMAEHTIPFDPITGQPKRTNYMWQFECASWEDLCVGKTLHKIPEFLPCLRFDSHGELKTRRVRAADNLFTKFFDLS